MTHGELEAGLATDGRELLRLLLQDHLDLRAHHEIRLDEVVDAGGWPGPPSHGLRRLAAVEASHGSFEDATDAIARVTGQTVGKRQTEQLAARAAADFETFHATRTPSVCDPGDVLAISVDGKGLASSLTGPTGVKVVLLALLVA